MEASSRKLSSSQGMWAWGRWPLSLAPQSQLCFTQKGLISRLVRREHDQIPSDDRLWHEFSSGGLWSLLSKVTTVPRNLLLKPLSISCHYILCSYQFLEKGKWPWILLLREELWHCFLYMCWFILQSNIVTTNPTSTKTSNLQRF